MNSYIASTFIVVPNWAIWVAVGMWLISTALTVAGMVLRGKAE